MTFDTVPFTAQSIAAPAAITYPSRGRRREAGSTGSGASLTVPSLFAALPPTLLEAGRSSAWLERLLWEQEAGGSNPPVPI